MIAVFFGKWPVYAPFGEQYTFYGGTLTFVGQTFSKTLFHFRKEICPLVTFEFHPCGVIERIFFRIALKNFGVDILFAGIFFRPILFEQLNSPQRKIASFAIGLDVIFHIKCKVIDIGFFAEFDFFLNSLFVKFSAISRTYKVSGAVGYVIAVDVTGTGLAVKRSPAQIIVCTAGMGGSRPEVVGALDKKSGFLQRQRTLYYIITVTAHCKSVDPEVGKFAGCFNILDVVVIKTVDEFFGRGGRFYSDHFIRNFPPGLYAIFPL